MVPLGKANIRTLAVVLVGAATASLLIVLALATLRQWVPVWVPPELDPSDSGGA